MVDRAFNACVEGVNGAQDQCLDVMAALGTLYNTARTVLDKINPDRWVAPKHSILLKKRQVLLGETG